MARKLLGYLWTALFVATLPFVNARALHADTVPSDIGDAWYPVFLDSENTLRVDLPTRSFMGLEFRYLATAANGFSFSFDGSEVSAGNPVLASDLSVLSIELLDQKAGTVGVLSLDRSYSNGLFASLSPRKDFFFRFIGVQFRREAIETLESELREYKERQTAFDRCYSDLSPSLGDWFWPNVRRCEDRHLIPEEVTISVLEEAFEGMNRFDTTASIQRYIDENRARVWFQMRKCGDEIASAVSDWMEKPSEGLALGSIIDCED